MTMMTLRGYLALLDYEGAAKRVPPRLVRNIDMLVKYTHTNRDAIVLVVSKEGEGKSTLVYEASTLVARDNPDLFVLDNIVYAPEHFEKRILEAPRHSAIDVDEGTSLFLRGDANTKWGRQRVKFLSQIRSRNHIMFVTLTESGFARADPQVIHDRATALIRITKRGRMWWYSKQKLVQIDVDPVRRMVKRWGEPNWKGSFKQLPKDVYIEYENYKHKKLEELNRPEEEKGEFNPDERWVGTKEAMKILGFKRAESVLQRVKDGTLPAAKTRTGRWRFRAADVLALLSNYRTSLDG